MHPPPHDDLRLPTITMSVRRALAPRSIHLRIVPRPANLSESREILRVLQRFGEISIFKYLRVCLGSENMAIGCTADTGSMNTKTRPTTLLLPSMPTRHPPSAPSTPRPFALPSKRLLPNQNPQRTHPPCLLKTKTKTSYRPRKPPQVRASTRSYAPPHS